MRVADGLEEHLRPIGDVILLPGNPRRGDVSKIAESLARFGQLKPIVVDSDGVILAGNHTYQAARQLGWSEIAAVTASELEGAERTAFALADNRLSDLATYDDDALVAMIREVDEATGDLSGVGYDMDDLAELGGDDVFAPEIADSEVEEPPDEAITELGDVWLLGDHRLICGDAFDADVGHIDAVVTDPPYAIYGSSSGVSSKTADDRMVEPFFRDLARRLADVLPVGGHAYVHCDWRSWGALWNGARPTDMAVKNMLVWDKMSSGMGSNYANSHELIAFLNHWPERKAIASQEADRNHRPVLTANVLRVTREYDKLHNAAKPVPLLTQLIENSTDRGDVILDLFAGSGSTLIAAENTGRRSVMVEIEPGWCDVIVKRFRSTWPDADVEHLPADA